MGPFFSPRPKHLPPSFPRISSPSPSFFHLLPSCLGPVFFSFLLLLSLACLREEEEEEGYWKKEEGCRPGRASRGGGERNKKRQTGSTRWHGSISSSPPPGSTWPPHHCVLPASLFLLPAHPASFSTPLIRNLCRGARERMGKGNLNKAPA